MAEEVVGFTEKQRQWFLERDGHRCQFYEFDPSLGRWVRCKHTTKLQVHHILPRGWAKLHLPITFQVNGSLNGVTLCREHHVGKKSIHPDTFTARQQYRAGNKQAFKDMMDARRKLNETGQPYWNTRWDWMFNRIVRKQTGRYSKQVPYPVNGNRGNTGRIDGMKHTRKRRQQCLDTCTTSYTKPM